jgi:hypothetical protein
MLAGRGQCAVDLAESRVGIVKDRNGAGYALEYFMLKPERPEAVMQQRMFVPFLNARRAADDDYGR